MKDTELTHEMSVLYNALISKQITPKQAIQRAVQLGMNYQELKIKQGIDIVFNTLHEKN